MDPFLNPYAPGAGTQPPELAGRDELLQLAAISLRRIASGKPSRGHILTGLRGVGKTVLLNRIRMDAEKNNIITIRIEVPENRSLPALLAPGLKSALHKLQHDKAPKELITQGLRALTSFISAMKIKYHDIEIGLELNNNHDDGLLLNNLDESLTQVFSAMGQIAKNKKTALVLFFDEIHLLNRSELASLLVALHMTSQDALPIAMIAAGLPQVPSLMGEAKTYAERLFEFHSIGPLKPVSAKQALLVPVEKLNVTYDKNALEEIIHQTHGYPYFLQEWGRHAWDIAKSSPISLQDIKFATTTALNDLDSSFFRVRYEQLTLIQKKYLRAMAELGPAPQSSGKIASLLNKPVSQVSSLRDHLISKGVIYSPSYGETAFTVPLFDEFIKRMMP